MTDKEKLINLLNEFGVGFTQSEHTDFDEVNCEQGQAKVEGYVGFATSFQFKKDGSFIAMGAYE